MMTRQSHLDEPECFAPIKSGQPFIADEQVKVDLINTKGIKIQSESLIAVAKKVSNGRYFIKSNKYGRFFDPAVNQDDVLKMTDNQGETLYTFKEVTLAQFDSYVEYINGKCQNTFLLRNAERGN